MITDEKQISKNMKSIRVKIGFSQEDIAKKMNIAVRTYKNIENHPLRYSINKLNIVANILCCNVNEFFLPITFTHSE